MTFQFSSALQWWLPNWILCVCTCICVQTLAYYAFVLLCYTVGEKKTEEILLVSSESLFFMFMQCIISKITNRIGWIDYLRIFGVLTVFAWKIWIRVGTIIKKITIFLLLLNKWYEIFLFSGCQKLWMYEPDLWGWCVFHINAGLFSSTGDGWEVGDRMPFISLDLWTRPNTGGHWHGADAGKVIRCYSWILSSDLSLIAIIFTYLKIFIIIKEIIFPCHFHHFNINLSNHLQLFFKAVDSPQFFWMRSNGCGSLIYYLLFCYLQTNSNRFEINNTCRAIVLSVSLQTYETAPFIFCRVWADLPLTGNHRKLFVLCKWWLMTCLAKPAVFDKKYWWLLSVKC